MGNCNKDLPTGKGHIFLVYRLGVEFHLACLDNFVFATIIIEN